MQHSKCCRFTYLGHHGGRWLLLIFLCCVSIAVQVNSVACIFCQKSDSYLSDLLSLMIQPAAQVLLPIAIMFNPDPEFKWCPDTTFHPLRGIMCALLVLFLQSSQVSLQNSFFCSMPGHFGIPPDCQSVSFVATPWGVKAALPRILDLLHSSCVQLLYISISDPHCDCVAAGERQ